MAERHHFRLKLPNGAEVDFGGDNDFVTEVYRDTKAAAVTLFNREAARTSSQDAVDRLLASSDPSPPGLQIAPPPPALPQSQAATTPAGATAEQPTTPAGGPAGGPGTTNVKPKKPAAKADPVQKAAKQARVAEIAKILRAQSFDDFEAYTGAIKAADNPLDRAALVACLAHDKFGFLTGLSPAEVHKILNDRFRVGQDNSALKKAMKEAPSTIFVDGPADFDGRARLYRPMNGAAEKVQKLLEVQKNPRVNTAPAPEGNGATA